MNISQLPRIVRGDRTRTGRRLGRAPWNAERLWTIETLICLVVGAAWTGDVGRAQEAGGMRFQATVQDVEDQSQNVTVGLNRSMIIAASEPVKRVQAIASEIAYVQLVSPQQILVTGVDYGTTQVLVWGESGEQSVITVSVELDLEALNEALKRIDPQGDAMATSVHGHIVLTGTVTGAETAKRMVELATLSLPPGGEKSEFTVQNHLDVSGEHQVLLRCTVAEVNRSAVRALGINGFVAGENVRDMFVVNQIGGINPGNIGAAADALVTAPIPFLTGENGIPLGPSSTLSLGFPRVQMQLFLKALADNSLLRVLAEPNLVAISGETATFLAGGEFPIPVPQASAGSTTITIEYREFGVRLNFTPVVKTHGRIRLRVAPEVSELDFSNAVQLAGFVVPGLTQRRSETTIELGSGQTFAIAGLLADEVRGIATRVPGIGDLPVLGPLFRSVEYRRKQAELVILVTPEIVAPLNPNEVGPVPGENLLEPSDMELYGRGLLEGVVAVLSDEPQSCSPEGVPDHNGGMEAEIAERTPQRATSNHAYIHGPWGYEERIP